MCHIKMLRLEPDDIEKTRNKLRELIERRKARESVRQGPFDETYYSALDLLDGEPLEVGMRF